MGQAEVDHDGLGMTDVQIASARLGPSGPLEIPAGVARMAQSWGKYNDLFGKTKILSIYLSTQQNSFYENNLTRN